MYYGGHKVQNLTIEYTNCASLASTEYYSAIPSKYYSLNFEKKLEDLSNYNYPQWKLYINESEKYEEDKNVCRVQFEIPNSMGPPVLFFYKLTNFHQNHRRYVKSFSEDQLNGKAASISTIKDTTGQNCQPLTTNEDGVPYYPCGVIANSLFNDTFTSLTSTNNTDSSNYEMTDKGIAWSTDKNRFKKTSYNASAVVPPPNWVKAYPDGYNDSNIPDISQWEHFQNWMRTSGLPTFSKLEKRNDDDPLNAGIYEVAIGEHFPVKEYNGKKAIVISTRSVIGGRSIFLGVSWIVVGALCFILAMVFLITHLVKPRKLGDHRYLSWNKDEKTE